MTHTASIRLRRASAALAALALAGGVAACGSSSVKSASSPGGSSPGSGSASASSTGSSTATTINAAAHTSGPTLRVGDQSGTGAQALLQAAGLLHSFSFPVKFADFTSGPPILQAIGAGALDIGNIGNAPPVFAAAGGAKIKIVGALKNDNTNIDLLVPKGSTITSVKQLKGKKIAVAQGSSADYHLLYTLKQNGMTAKDVQLVYLQPAQGLAAFSSGAVDAWDIWPPFAEQAQIQKGACLLAGGTTGQSFAGNYSYAVASDSAVANPARAKEITAFVTAINRAHVWANTHPLAWAKTWGAATGLPANIMQAAARHTVQVPVPVDARVVAAEQGLVDIFAANGLIPKQYSFAQYTSTAFNSSVR